MFHMKAKNYLTLLLFSVFTIVNTYALTPEAIEHVAVAAQDQQPTLIEQLQNGESYSIEITSVGCFHGTRQTLVVYNEEGVLKANFNDISMELSNADIQAFVSFEDELRSLKIGGCTTVDTYVLRFGNDTFRTNDGTCNWNGGKKLLQHLGLI